MKRIYLIAGHHDSDSMIINLKNNCHGSNWSKVKGVYQIRCLINNKIYIGSTSKLDKRFNKHKRNLINNRHHSIALQNAFNKYGIDKFEFSVLEECDDLDKLQELEQFYLDYYQSYDRDKGYNILKEAYRGILGFKHSEETKRKISQSVKNMWKNPVIRNKILNNTSRIKSKETCERISKSKQKFNYSKDYLNYLYNCLNMNKKDMSKLLGVTERTLKDNLQRMGVKKSKENFDKMMCDIRRNNKSKWNRVNEGKHILQETTGVIFTSIKEFCWAFNLNYQKTRAYFNKNNKYKDFKLI